MEPRWYELPRLDYLLAAAVVAIHAGLVWRFDTGDVLAWGGAAQRTQLYFIAAAVAALMLTVGTSSLAMYLGGTGQRVREFREDVGVHGLALILSVITALLMLSLVSVVAIAIDVRNGSNAWMRWVFEAFFVLTVWRAARAMKLYADQVHGELQDALDEAQRRDHARVP